MVFLWLLQSEKLNWCYLYKLVGISPYSYFKGFQSTVIRVKYWSMTDIMKEWATFCIKI